MTLSVGKGSEGHFWGTQMMPFVPSLAFWKGQACKVPIQAAWWGRGGNRKGLVKLCSTLCHALCECFGGTSKSSGEREGQRLACGALPGGFGAAFPGAACARCVPAPAVPGGAYARVPLSVHSACPQSLQTRPHSFPQGRRRRAGAAGPPGAMDSGRRLAACHLAVTLPAWGPRAPRHCPAATAAAAAGGPSGHSQGVHPVSTTRK